MFFDITREAMIYLLIIKQVIIFRMRTGHTATPTLKDENWPQTNALVETPIKLPNIQECQNLTNNRRHIWLIANI